MKNSVPELPLRFFRWFCHPKLRDNIEGDLIELHEERVIEFGKRKADIKFIIDVMLLFRIGIIKPTEGYKNLNDYGMLKSYFKIEWRNLLRNKGYSFINIGGLTAGLTITILIGLWIYDELSFNRYFSNYSTIAQVYRREIREDQSFASIFQTTGLGELLKTDYDSYFDKVVMMNTRTQEVLISANDKKFTQIGYFMQPEGIEMFSVKILSGSAIKLKDVNSILLCQSLAKKIFGDKDPVDQVISLDARLDLKVIGVYEDLPRNSEFYDASFFAPLEQYTANLNIWDNYNVRIYVQLKGSADVDAVSSVIRQSSKPYIPADKKQEFFLHPMNKWHLNSEFENGVEVRSKRLMAIWYYGLIGMFVLFLACINFMNLSTARSEDRAKEVGIRKTVGSLRSQLALQFFVESLLVTLLSFLSALLLVNFCLPWFNNVADKNILIPFQNPHFWIASMGFVLLTSVIAGSYPALYLSSFKPVKALKGRVRASKFALSSRKVLVVAQFTVSVVLTIGTIVVYQQIGFAKDRPVGYERENLIGLRAASPEYKGKYDVLRNKLTANGLVEEIAEANYSITETLGANDGFSWRGKIYGQSFNTIVVTPEYGKTVGWEFVSGRDFSRDLASDSSGVVINESALKIFGIPNPENEFIHWTHNERTESYKILGVVKDMVKGSPYSPTDPSIIFHSRSNMQWLYIRLNPKANPHETLPKLAKIFAEIVPSASFDFKFADDEYNAKFKSEERMESLATVFTALAILISCLGLVGLTAFSAEARSKEIGIRKVIGASTLSLWRLMAKEYVVLVGLACLVAIPIGSYFMISWLQQYDYRTTISVWTLINTSLGALGLTLLTVSYHSIRAATANPVKNLRSE